MKKILTNKKIWILIAFIILLFLVRDYLNVEQINKIINTIGTHPLAPFIFIGVYSISVVFAIPASILSIAAGPLFGFWQGLIYVIIASNIGCHISYFIAKLLGKDAILKYFKGNDFINSATTKAQENAFVFMMYVRLIPLFPFAAVNYLSGILNIEYKKYALGTFLGMIPGTAVYVYLGFSASNIQDNPLSLIVSIVVLALFTVIVTIVSKRKKTIKNES